MTELRPRPARGDRSLRIVVAALFLVVGTGIGLFVLGSSSSKISDLGTTLIGSALVGAVLVLLEQALAGRADQSERKIIAFGAAATATDSVIEPVVPVEVVAETVSVSGSNHYAVYYTGWQRDPDRVDVFSARLRVLRNSQYFQFFTASVPGLDFALAVEALKAGPGAVQRAVVDEAVGHIRGMIERGEAPRSDDPTKAIEVRPELNAVLRRARDSPQAVYDEESLTAEFEV